MKKKGLNNLRVMLVFYVFSLMLISHFFIGAVAFSLWRLGIILPREGNFRIYIILLLFTSIVLVTVTTGIGGKKMLRPIRRLIQATDEVARGNFDIQIEAFGHSELDDLTHSFNKMVKELGSVEIMRNDFVTSISHEFKTPIASIQGYATLLQDDELTDDERREYTDMIIAASRQLSSLAGNILKLSKLDNQGIISEETEFELDEQIRRIILLLEPGWSEKDIELDIDLESTRYRGCEELLHQVWLNLLDNAVKFTDKGGIIAIRLSQDKDYITVTITDSGIGIQKDMVKHVFDKFYQGDKSRSSEGNGLGLALVKRIVELSSGSVQVQSEPDKGSVFTVKLPVAD